jgi:hypothetical protein
VSWTQARRVVKFSQLSADKGVQDTYWWGRRGKRDGDMGPGLGVAASLQWA